MRINNSRICVVASLAMYILSCFLPCFHVGEKDISYYGYFVLLLGWAGVFVHDDIRIHFVAWYANILYFIAFFLRKYKVSRWFAYLAFVVSLLFIGCPYIVVDEAGHFSSIKKIDIGYVVWVTSILLLGIGIASSKKTDTDII